MSILLSGDFHANNNSEISSITKDKLIKKYGEDIFNEIRYHIILGDAGFLLPENKRKDSASYFSLSRRKFPVLCVIGDYDPVLGMNNLKETDIGIGETVYLIKEKEPDIAYLKRGKVYTIDGIKFLVLGGALSLEKNKMIAKKTWWEKEYWSEQEKKDLFKLLETDNSYDCVISHTGPLFMNNYFIKNLGLYKEQSFDEVAFMNGEIEKRINFQFWFCSHFKKYFDCTDEAKNSRYLYFHKITRVIRKEGNQIKFSSRFGIIE